MNERMGARPWLAHTQSDYAHMLVVRGDRSDRERAGKLLESGGRDLQRARDARAL